MVRLRGAGRRWRVVDGVHLASCGGVVSGDWLRRGSCKGRLLGRLLGFGCRWVTVGVVHVAGCRGLVRGEWLRSGNCRGRLPLQLRGVGRSGSCGGRLPLRLLSVGQGRVYAGARHVDSCRGVFAGGRLRGAGCNSGWLVQWSGVGCPCVQCVDGRLQVYDTVLQDHTFRAGVCGRRWGR